MNKKTFEIEVETKIAQMTYNKKNEILENVCKISRINFDLIQLENSFFPF